MTFNELESTAFAYFLVSQGPSVNVAGRWFPRMDFIHIFEDKVQIACRKFGRRVVGTGTKIANEFVDLMIEKGALTVKKDDFGGTLHQFQLDPYRALIQELTAADPIVAKAQAAGPEFWEQAFAELTA